MTVADPFAVLTFERRLCAVAPRNHEREFDLAGDPVITPRIGMRRLVPRALKRRLRSLQGYPDRWRLVSDWHSFRQLSRLEDPAARWSEQATASVRFRALGGAPLSLRPRSADMYLPRDTFLKAHHLPPTELEPSSIGLVWDLGSNIGFTIAHIATRCPNARIIGVELDADNAAVCERNLGPWRDRCEILQAAVWTADGEIDYRRDAGDEQGFHIAADGPRGATAQAPALSLDTLLEAHTPERQIDYVKMDIEGAEAHVLKENTDWAAHVRSIKVEVHPPYGVAECSQDLRRLGFHTTPIAKRRGGVTGIRETDH